MLNVSGLNKFYFLRNFRKRVKKTYCGNVIKC